MAYNFSPHSLPFAYCAPATEAVFLFLKHIEILPTSRPWHLIVPLPGSLFPLDLPMPHFSCHLLKEPFNFSCSDLLPIFFYYSCLPFVLFIV